MASDNLYRIYTDSRWFDEEWNTETLPEFIEVPQVFITVDYIAPNTARAYIERLSKETVISLPGYIDLTNFRTIKDRQGYQIRVREGSPTYIAGYFVRVYGSYCTFKIPNNTLSIDGQAMVSRIRKETNLRVLGFTKELGLNTLEILPLKTRFERI